MKMKKIIFGLLVLFAFQAKAQKAFDNIIFKGSWGNFNITVKYAAGYTEASEVITKHKKTKAVKLYRFHRITDENVFFANPSNKTSFSVKNFDAAGELPKTIRLTIYYNGKEEEIVVKQGG
jgi:uncharacterized protein YxeA